MGSESSMDVAKRRGFDKVNMDIRGCYCPKLFYVNERESYRVQEFFCKGGEGHWLWGRGPELAENEQAGCLFEEVH